MPWNYFCVAISDVDQEFECFDRSQKTAAVIRIDVRVACRSINVTRVYHIGSFEKDVRVAIRVRIRCLENMYCLAVDVE